LPLVKHGPVPIPIQAEGGDESSLEGVPPDPGTDMNALAIQPSFLAVSRPWLRFLHVAKEDPLTESERSQTPTADLAGLLARVAEGDHESFARLYDAISPAIYGTILKTIRSREHAEEVTQEVFLEIWRKSAEWDPRLGSPATWMMVMARRRAVDRIRREEALRQREERVAPTWNTAPHSEVEDVVANAEDHAEVRNGLDSLSDIQRQVIELAYFGDHTYAEVARMLDLPLGTVKTRMRDGLLRLKRSFGVVT
jgi:RNA polymerase sigma-70 factor, ECF subfamily